MAARFTRSLLHLNSGELETTEGDVTTIVMDLTDSLVLEVGVGTLIVNDVTVTKTKKGAIMSNFLVSCCDDWKLQVLGIHMLPSEE